MTLIELIPLLATAVSGLFGWLIGRRKTAAEADGNELENVERALGIYRNFVDDLRKEIALLRVEISALTAQNVLLLKENREVDDLRKEIASLRTEIGALTAQNVLLLKENRELKQQLEGVERTLNAIKPPSPDGALCN